MAQPPATNIHYRNNTSTTNQPPQLLTNIKSTQIAAKKKKKTHNQRETEWKADREEREEGEIDGGLGVRSPARPKPITG